MPNRLDDVLLHAMDGPELSRVRTEFNQPRILPIVSPRLGSMAEQVFRHADCFVVTVGPGSYKDSLVKKTEAARPFLLATDFGAASLYALPHAISFANQFGAKLVVLHVLPGGPIPDGFHWSLRQVI
jgi:Universal stress protein family